MAARAEAAYRDGRLEDASQLLLPLAADGEEGARAHNLLGMILAARDSLDRAREEFKSALDANPDLALAHNNLGALYLLEGRHGLAELAFAQAATLDPEYPEPLDGEALVALDKQRLGEAQHAAARAARVRAAGGEAQARKRAASLQSLDSWPWQNVDALIAEEAERRASRPDAGRGDDPVRGDSATGRDAAGEPRRTGGP